MTVQSHLHLALEVGGTENAPIWRWVATEREVSSDITVSIKQTLRGRIRTHVLADENGPIILYTWRYKIKVMESFEFSLQERIQQLISMTGRPVYLVDHFHPDDGFDHTEATNRVFCEVGPFPFDHTGLQFFYVEVTLTDLRNE
jgi:hypothetical protein